MTTIKFTCPTCEKITKNPTTSITITGTAWVYCNHCTYVYKSPRTPLGDKLMVCPHCDWIFNTKQQHGKTCKCSNCSKYMAVLDY